eukprot:jgi/Tetstr1/453125/TSEL_040148.t2
MRAGESNAPLRPNIRKGHHAFPVALKDIEEKQRCFYADPGIVTDQHFSSPAACLVGVLAQEQKRAGGIIKHNINTVNNMAATQAVPGDKVGEGSSLDPPAKKAK